MTRKKKEQDGAKMFGTTPFFVADRGDCSFVTKVRNIEKAGAGMGLVVDSSDEPIENVVMSDDGTGAGIRIPSMLISKKDGIKLIDFLTTAKKELLDQIMVIATFDMRSPDNRVEYDIWYSSSNDMALDFITKFSKVDKALGENVLMTPHFVFKPCMGAGCTDEFKKDNCFADGKYCSSDPTHPKIKGVEIMLEDLRQMCIYQKTY